jgi:molecular chaperone GrpE
VLKDIVPVLDDLRRALGHWSAEQEGGGATLVEGLEMVARKFEQTLGRRGVKAVDAAGQPFDPQFHEAIQQTDDDSVPHNTVVQEFQRGYVIHDRLLRPALVVVAQGGPVAIDEDSDESESEGGVSDVAEEPNVGQDNAPVGEVSDDDESESDAKSTGEDA